MAPSILRALKASIKHWLANTKARTRERTAIFAADCPLCQELGFDDTCNAALCRDCPIGIYTGVAECRGTPWKKVEQAYDGWWSSNTPSASLRYTRQRNRFIRAAKAELAFLKRLLPKK